MRPDMGKVITERPRSGGRVKTPKGSKRRDQQYDLEDQPKREKIRQKWHNSNGGSKQSTDVLGPLRGYVLSVVGRPFAKVNSEISKVLRPTGLSGSHAQDHFWDMLVTKVYIDEEGYPCHSDMTGVSKKGYGKRLRLSPSMYSSIAYVDPRDGIIKKVKECRFNHHKQRAEIVRKKIDATHQCHKIEGIWYLVEVEPVKFTYSETVTFGGWKGRFFVQYTDLLIGHVDAEYKVREFYGGDYKAVSKKQMNKKEIKKYLK